MTYHYYYYYIFKTLLTALLPVEHVCDDRDVTATKVDIHLWTRVLAWTLMHFQYDIFALIRVTSLDTHTHLVIITVSIYGIWFLRFLVYQNTALFSTFRPFVHPSVTDATAQLFSTI